MNIKSKPPYTSYISGFPDGIVEFYPIAAKELGVNNKIEYHGCVVRTLYEDKSLGVRITDNSVEQLKFEEQNELANQYYIDTIGEDWQQKLKDRAVDLCEESDDEEMF